MQIRIVTPDVRRGHLRPMIDKRDEKLFSAKAAKALAMSLTAFAGRRYVLSRVIGTISPLLTSGVTEYPL